MTKEASTLAKIEQQRLRTGVREHGPDEVAQSQQRRLQLSLAHLSCERGYEMASIDEIAELAKLSKSTLYQHFGGREALLQSVASEFRASVGEAIDRELNQAVASGLAEPERWTDAVAASVSGFCMALEAEPELARLSSVEGSAVLGRDGGAQPLEIILDDLLAAAARAEDSPPKPEGVPWTALVGAFKSTVQDQVRGADGGSVETDLPHALTYLIVVAHLGKEGVGRLSR